MGILADFQAWKKKVEVAVPDTLITDVKKAVEEDFVEATEQFVYDAYSPKYYADGSVFGRMRRFSAGGIQTVSLINSNLAGKYTLVMEQVAPANSSNPQGQNAIEWVESGQNVPARQFYAPLEAKTIPHAQQALIAGMHKRGL